MKNMIDENNKNTKEVNVTNNAMNENNSYKNNDNSKLLDLTQQLIGFKSITPNQAGCLNFIESYLKNLNFDIIRLDRNDTCNLFAIWNNHLSGCIPNKPVLAFAGHIDVVPPGDLEQWKYNPFNLTLDNEILYGRGIADMKGSIACFLQATTEYITQLNTDSNIAIAFAITSDEEGKAIDGTPVIVEYLKQNNIMLDYCIIGEPSCANTIGDTIKIGRRGSLTAHINVLGKQGHVAYPELCINPIHSFANALAELTNTTWDTGNEHFPATSLQFTNIKSGLGVDNVIPNDLQVNFNIRYNPTHTVQSLQNKIINIFDKHNLKYDISWRHSASPFLSNSGALLNATINAINDCCHITPKLKTDGGTSDGRFLIAVCKELLELGLNNSTIHQINECTKLNDLMILKQIYHTILTLINNKYE